MKPPWQWIKCGMSAMKWPRVAAVDEPDAREALELIKVDYEEYR